MPVEFPLKLPSASVKIREYSPPASSTLIHSPERVMFPLRSMVGAVVLWGVAQATLAADTPAKKDADAKVSYYKEVRPIFQQHCQGCHQPAKAQGGYVMSAYADLFKKTEHDNPGIVHGKPQQSAVYQQIIPQ